MSHYSRSAHGSDYERRGRSSSRSRDRVAPPVVYSTTRRSSSVGAGHSGRISPGGYYAVSDTGRVRRHHSSERHRDGGQGYSNYHYITAPSTSANGHHHRRSSSSSQNAPTYYVTPTSTAHYNRPRSGSESHYYDTRRHHYPDVRVMSDHNPERARHRSRSVESRRSSTEHEGFGEKMRRLFGLGPSGQHEARRHNVYYEDPGSGRRAVTSGKAYRSKQMQYMDKHTGREVDERGRPIYTV